MALEERLRQETILDIRFRGSMLVLRWVMLLSYILLVNVGVFDITDRALFLSAAFIFVYDLFHIWLFFAQSQSRAIFAATRYMDVLTITAPLLALHDERNPVWAIYFICIVSMANLISRREMVTYVFWTNANYVAVAGAVTLMGHDVSWGYVVTVSILLQFMGFSAGVIAGGQERLREVIAEMAVTDSLTGLANRRRFHDIYTSCLQEALERHSALAVMLIDVDHFKEINDTHGHPAGDDKLREVAQSLKTVARSADLVARYGGDEFVVVAPGAPRDAALALAERLRVAAAGCGASVSIGVALFPDDAQRHEDLLEAADAALYRAKQAGRNCVRDALAA